LSISGYKFPNGLKSRRGGTTDKAESVGRFSAVGNFLIKIGLRIILLKNCGHFPYIEVPAEFFKTLGQFLARISK